MSKVCFDHIHLQLHTPTPPVPPTSFYMLCPEFLTINNSPSLNSAAHLHMRIRSVTGVWLTFQGPHPWRKLVLSTPAAFCHHQLLRQGWALGTHPPTHGNVDCVGFVREPQMLWACACVSPAKVQKTLSSGNSPQPLQFLHTLIRIPRTYCRSQPSWGFICNGEW